jgi:hypothetical protein
MENEEMIKNNRENQWEQVSPLKTSRKLINFRPDWPNKKKSQITNMKNEKEIILLPHSLKG